MTPSVFENRLSPEAQIVLLSARRYMGDALIAKTAALIREGCDWKQVIDTAHDHGVLPLLCRHLLANFEGSLPESVTDDLKERQREQLQHNLVMTGALLSLIESFQDSGIPVVPFRGPVLAASLYGDVGLRQFGDLDLLVHKSDVIRARDLLIERGYRPYFQLPKRETSILRRGEYAFLLDSGRIFIDLHWDTGGLDFSLPPAGLLWKRRDTVELEGRSVPCLSREDRMLLFSMHGTKHNWRRLAWITDMAGLVRTGRDIDWNSVIREASRLRIARMVGLALYLANQVLGAEVPREAKHLLKGDSAIPALASRVLENLFSPGSPGLSEDPLFFIRSMDATRDRLRYLALRVFAPTPWLEERVRLPSSLFFLYHLIRPLGLLRQYGIPRLRRKRHGNRTF